MPRNSGSQSSSDRSARYTRLSFVLLVELVSGYTTYEGVKLYFFSEHSWAVLMTVVINGTIVYTAYDLKRRISYGSWRKTWLVPNLVGFFTAVALSVFLSGVGAYRNFAFKTLQTQDLTAQIRGDFDKNSRALEGLRRDNLAAITNDLEQSGTKKINSDRIAKNSRKSAARNQAFTESARLGRRIEQLAKARDKFEQTVIPQFDETPGANADATAENYKKQLAALKAISAAFENAHQSLPDDLRKAVNFPPWSSSEVKFTDEQSGFVNDLQARKTPAIIAFLYGFLLELFAVCIAFGDVKLPTSAERIKAAKAWLRAVFTAVFGLRVASIEIENRETGLVETVNFERDESSLIGSDVLRLREPLERRFSRRLSRPVHIAAFLNSENEEIETERSLISQLGEGRTVFVTFADADNENGEFPNEVFYAT